MAPRALIIGGGPAGLTAAHELLERTDYQPIVFEGSQMLGGISRTEVHHGNRIDIGGHRFFSKSDRVMDWWLSILPLSPEAAEADEQVISYQNKQRSIETAGRTSDDPDRIMLLRERKSRIYFTGKFFDYPISLTPDTVMKLGLLRTARIGASYAKARARPLPETNLENFFINRFGNELYNTFFKEYTEKVWGEPCDEISAEWGAQRIKGLSITKAILHFFKNVVPQPRDISQKDVETSLIEQFLYPKYGPGQMWEEVGRRIEEAGGEIRMGWKVIGLKCEGDEIKAVVATDPEGKEHTIEGDLVFSTMPVRELVAAMDASKPGRVAEVASKLQYRDFMTVGLLVDELAVTEPDGSPITDNWIYVQEPGVEVGRLQVFNNWSPYLVADPSKTWIGLEYFCYETDKTWKMSDEDMIALGTHEMEKIGILRPGVVRDAVRIRVPKTYPGYFGAYEHFEEVKDWVSGFRNLFLIGRNGMHRYNNQDHSMLTAMTAVDNLVAGSWEKANIWSVNTEQEYHEEK